MSVAVPSQTIAAPASEDVVPAARKLAYALPGLPIHVMHFAALAILPTFYAKNTQVTVAEIGLILIATRIFDAVIDPGIGFVSDKLAPSLGRRWMVVAGALACAVAAYFVFTPPPTATALYFATWSLCLYGAWSVMEIPHRAWGAELTRDYKERSRLFAVLAQLRIIGALLFLGAPFLPIFSSTSMTQPAVLAFVAVALAIALPFSVLVAATFVPEGRQFATAESTAVGLVRSVITNKPFWLFSAVFALSGMGIGLYNAVLLLFVNDYLGIGEQYAMLGLIYFAVALPMMSVWSFLMNRIGKHRAWAIGLGAFALILPLYWFVPPGPESIPYAIVLTVLVGMTSSSSLVAPMAVLGDIIDYDTMKTGVNRSANYYALLQLAQTMEVAIGGGLGFLMLGWFGYDAKGENGPDAVFGLKITFLLLPAIVYLISAALILYTPIDAKRHAVIRRALQRRAKRAKV